MRRTTLTGIVVVLMAAFALPAGADELSDFEAARRNYDKQSYAKAAKGFESLVGGVVPRARNPVVRLEARKYLGATYLFLGRDEDDLSAIAASMPAFDAAEPRSDASGSVPAGECGEVKLARCTEWRRIGLCAEGRGRYWYRTCRYKVRDCETGENRYKLRVETRCTDVPV